MYFYNFLFLHHETGLTTPWAQSILVQKTASAGTTTTTESTTTTTSTTTATTTTTTTTDEYEYDGVIENGGGEQGYYLSDRISKPGVVRKK